MSTIKQVQRGIDFIEERLDGDIELSEVAHQAGISRWHFQRIFKAVTNETLKSYIRSRRMARSLDKLLTTDERIIEIALAAGYDSQESFTRAFRKAFQLTPNEYRKLGDKSLFLKKVQIDTEYLRHLRHGVSLAPEISRQGPMRLVGLQTQFFSVDSEKNNIAAKLPALWQEFVPRMAEIEHRVEGIACGVIRQTQEHTEQLEYTAAVEVERAGELPARMCCVEVPAATYARFTHRGAVANLDHTVSYAYSTWLLDSDMRHTYGPDIEIYGAEYHSTSAQSVIHYQIPVAPRSD